LPRNAGFDRVVAGVFLNKKVFSDFDVAQK